MCSSMLIGVPLVIAVSIVEWMTKENVVCIQNILLLNHKNNETPVICNNTDVPREDYAERNKPGRIK